MDRQLLFDRAVKGILKQGGPSFDTDRQICRYTDKEGRHCALALAFPEKFLSALIEERGAATQLTDVVGLAKALEYPDPEDEYFLGKLQSVHDNACLPISKDFLSAFKEGARAFAKSYSLTIPSELCAP